MKDSAPASLQGRRCDVFCNIVDNYGDIGVAWRLARQLAREHGLEVRLWVDELASFVKLRPEADAGQAIQTVQSVEVRRWGKPFPPVAPAEIVIETFACDLPESYLEAMAAQEPKPLWINLDHLSAEDWVRECHRLPSPHPRLPITAHFFFPGFVEGTGGLLREADLLARRDSFLASATTIDEFWGTLGLKPPSPGEMRVSLFAYDNPGINELFEVWADGDEAIGCIVPEGLALRGVAAFFDQGSVEAGSTWRRGCLTVHVIPFLDQDDYDRLLWACDLNFVRGEDSFVRAQWAAHPFVWQIYIQKDDAHWTKLEAFLNVYCTGLEAEAAAALRDFTRAWNRGTGIRETWPRFRSHLDTLCRHARAWAATQAARTDLATNLVHFFLEKL